MPVVWCSNPNSVSKKPTAFALQGIQLQGNISEQHVLAVRELINAASEGRLLLPSDGSIVLLDCGVGVGSVIVPERNSLESKKNKEIERSNILNLIVQRTLHNRRSDQENLVLPKKTSIDLGQRSNEILYEFLCCARCISDASNCCNKKAQSSQIFAKLLDAKKGTGLSNKRTGNASYQISNRRKNTVSFKSEKRPLKKIQVYVGKIPIYATVDKQLKSKNRKPQKIGYRKRNDPIENIARDAIEPNDLSSTSNGSGRKTSFDSTCTVSSLDSGFMDMQNKLEITKNAAKNIKTDNKIQININTSEEIGMVDNTKNLPSNWSRLKIPSQSRNRRKSYEEFKSLFCDHQKQSSTSHEHRMDVKGSIKSRRKSYEEFKSATSVFCDNNSTHNCNYSSNTVNNELVIKNDSGAALSTEENSLNCLSKMKRKNSMRMSTQKTKLNNQTVNQKIDRDFSNPEKILNLTIYDILRKNSASNVTDANKSKEIYDKNLELFKSHCSTNKIKDFEKLLSCGTIYDIIQRKSDIYTKNFKRNDKYMTYGTLYEILHRKTDEDEQFERKRTLSEKFFKRRINYAHIDFMPPAENHNGTKTVTTATDSVDNNLNSTSESTSASSLKQGSGSANNQLSITSLGSQQLSTIYDILQTKKLETASMNPIGTLRERNRFLVRKITEEDLLEARKVSDDSIIELKKIDEVKLEESKPAFVDVQPKKQTRIRRFSNILSYTPKVSNETEKKTNEHLEAKIDELYSRLNRITRHNENHQFSKVDSDKEPIKIYKSNSLDMLSTLNESEAPFTLRKPIRKISVPAHQTNKVPPKKNTRRLSEFTRGEFLNEKS